MLRDKKKFAERDPLKVGILGILVVVAMLATALTSGSIYRAVTSVSYTAVFAEAAGLASGAEVRIGGLAAGKVEGVNLDGATVRVRFSVQGPGSLGEQTGAAIKTATALGVKYLAVLPSGPGQLADGAEIPLSRTSTPYDLTGILGQLTDTSARIDPKQLAQALDTVATTLKDTPQSLHTTLDGVNRLSQTVSGQDQALRDLLGRANSVTGVLAQRNHELSQLFDDGNLLLGELNDRRTLIVRLLGSATTMLTELNGLVRDNQAQLEPALQQLQGVLDLLNSDNQLLGSVLQGLNVYAGTLGDAVSGGPWFYGYIPNLPPTNIAPLLPDVLKASQP